MTFALSGAGLSLLRQAVLLLRIVVATACGGLIGIERSRRLKDAGVRTHCLVACAAAMLMIVSKYGFTDLGDAFPGVRGADPARIAAQIVSGVSFLGAGIIYRDRKLATRGLTTAAGIWAVAGVGMAIGAGLYSIGLFTTALMLLLQYLTHRHALGKDRYVGLSREVVMADDREALDALQRSLARGKYYIADSHISREGGSLHCEMVLRMESRRRIPELYGLVMEQPKVMSATINEED